MKERVCYCFTGSFCTLSRSLEVLRTLVARGYDVTAVMSENVYYTDTRFFRAEDLSRAVENLTGKAVIHTVADAEPLGPRLVQDLLVVAPCTGNTLAKLANGITDTAATMAIKAHLRQDRPTLIALCSNDAMSQNLANIASLICRKSVYFLPMEQDNPKDKPHSLVAQLERIPEAIDALWRGEQLRPLFV